MKLAKFLAAVTAAVMCISSFTSCTNAEALGGSMRDITTMDLVK